MIPSRGWPRGYEAMAQISTAIATPCIQLCLGPQSPIQPLPASSICLEERLRRDAKSGTSENSPVIGVLPIGVECFGATSESEEVGSIEVWEDGVEYVGCLD